MILNDMGKGIISLLEINMFDSIITFYITFKIPKSKN